MNLKKLVLIFMASSAIIIIAFFFLSGRQSLKLVTSEDIKEAFEKAGNGDKSSLLFLIKNLSNKNHDIRGKSYNNIIKIGKPSVPLLLELLDNTDPSVQEYAAAALGTIGDKKALPALINSLHSKHFHRKYVLCWALGEIGDPKAIIPLIDLYTKEKEDVQKYILRSISKIGQPALKILLKNLESSESKRQKLSILALGQIKGPDLVPSLLNIVNEKNRAFVILSIGDLADPEGIDFLIDSLTHPDWQIRQKSAQSLTRFTDSRILPPLRKALNDDVTAVREWAAKAIECISGTKCRYKNEKGELVYPDSLYH